jgi:Ni,Fe-hydrogenase III small subunit/formate hydrogenlyase subunit 6/NADH:ubiquinone oxidoreductase subunit I
MSLWDLIQIRSAQGTKTIPFPPSPEVAGLPARFRGRPVVDPTKCGEGCDACARACPVDAIAVTRGESPTATAVGGKREAPGLSPEGERKEKGELALDLGKCVFCVECVAACPGGAISFGQDWRLAASRREDLIVRGPGEPALAHALGEKMRRLFGRSLKLRQVSAGGCNGCEAELVASGNIIFDLGRFGVQFVASPRHADGLVITGPVSTSMRHALEETYRATPSPKIVIAVGACAIAGGPFFDSDLQHGGAASIVPVDLFIPGCPPHPITILDGLLRLLGKLEEKRGA